MEDENQLNKKALRSGAWYAVSNVLMRSVSIITAPIFTRLLSTDDYGIVSNYSAWQSIVMIFTGLCMTYSIGRAKLDFSDKFNSYISSIQSLSASIAFIFCIFAIIFQDWLSKFMHLDGGIIGIMFIYLIFSPSVDYIQIKYRYEFKYKENILISLINTLGTVAFSLLFIWIFNDHRYVGRIVGIILAIFLMGAYYFFKIIKDGKCLVNIEYWKYALKISLPMIPHALTMVILGQIDRIQILQYCSASDAGIYSFGYSYAILISLLINAVCQAWIPWQYEQHNSGNIDLVRSTNKIFNVLICFFTLVFIGLGPEAIHILGAKDYWSAVWIIAPVALGTLFQYYYSLYSNVEIFYKKTVMIGLSSIIAAILNVLLNIIFIPQYGYIAAAYTTFVSYFVLMVLHFIMYKIVCKDRLFDNIFIFGSVLITIIIGFGLMALYEYYILRYIIVGLILLIMFTLYYKRIIAFISSGKII